MTERTTFLENPKPPSSFWDPINNRWRGLYGKELICYRMFYAMYVKAAQETLAMDKAYFQITWFIRDEIMALSEDQQVIDYMKRQHERGRLRDIEMIRRFQLFFLSCVKKMKSLAISSDMFQTWLITEPASYRVCGL